MSPVQYHDKFQFCSKKTKDQATEEATILPSKLQLLLRLHFRWAVLQLRERITRERQEYIIESNKGRAVAEGGELEGEGCTLTEHWDSVLQCHRPWQPRAPTCPSSFWLLYSRNHPRVTSFSDLGPDALWLPSPTLRSEHSCLRHAEGKRLAGQTALQAASAAPTELPVMGQSLLQGPPDHPTITAAALSGYDYLKFRVSSYSWQVFTYKISITYNLCSATTK